MNGVNEVPPVYVEATGNVVLLYNETTKRIKLTINYTPMALIGAHIHKGDPGEDGAIIFPLDHTMNPIVFEGPVLTAAQKADLLAGKYYVNLHTAEYPDGIIRGQLTQQS
jgi:hypothetical protein